MRTERDIESLETEQILRREANNNTFRIALADTIRSLVRSGEIQRQAIQVIAEHFRVPRVNFAILQRKERTVTIEREHAPGLPSAIGEYSLAKYGRMMASEGGRTVIVEDVAADSRLTAEEKSSYQQLEISSVVKMGLLTKGRIAGALMLADTRVRDWSAAEVELMEESAQQVWAAMVRADAEVGLRAANAELIENDRRKNEFLAMLGHELRNPLAAMHGAVQMLEVTAWDPRSQHSMSILKRQARALNRIVDDLLDVSRVTRGAITLEHETVDLTTVVERALESVNPLLDQKQHETNLTLAATPVSVSGDPVRLEQILVNLLTNAAKYTDPGGHITLNIDARDGRAEIQVKDTGIGIAPGTQENMFALFGQAEPGLDRSQGGLGVGLTIAKTLVELHGGSINVYSAGLGQGAAFTVSLPLAARAETYPPVASQMRRELTAKRILVVEDSADIAETLALLLQEAGHQSTAVNSGASALNTIEEFAPDLVLLDIGLPGMDGYEVARRLRRNPRTRDLTLVALTGYGQERDRELAAAAGFDAHFVKPVDFAALQTFIENTGTNAIWQQQKQQVASELAW